MLYIISNAIEIETETKKEEPKTGLFTSMVNQKPTENILPTNSFETLLHNYSNEF